MNKTGINFMELNVTPQNWQQLIKGKNNVIAVSNHFIMIEDLKLLPVFDYPFKVNMAFLVICTKGSVRGKINLKPFEIKAPCLYSLLPNQTLQQDFVSDDFDGYAIVVSQYFIDSLFIETQQLLAEMFSPDGNPYKPMTAEDLELPISYYNAIKKIIGLSNNEHQLDVIRHLTLVFLYISDYFDKRIAKNSLSAATPQAILVGKFMNLLKEHFKSERQLAFYANRLCFTPKHLSSKIREATGKSAAEWIDDYVMLEAKALLKSTNMTIQQISDELNFDDQSVFGKYFKRIEGVSPKNYRLQT